MGNRAPVHRTIQNCSINFQDVCPNNAARLPIYGVVQAVVQLEYEKQHRLRPMMRMHGLSNSVYLMVMYLYFALQYLLYALIMIIGGVAAQLEFFKANSYGVKPKTSSAPISACPVAYKTAAF